MVDPGLNGKAVLVTGANNPHGIGAAVAHAFAAQGAQSSSRYFTQTNTGRKETSSGYSFYDYCVVLKRRRRAIQFCGVGNCNTCRSVPLLCRVPRSDQMQVQEFAHGVQNHSRAGWFSASH